MLGTHDAWLSLGVDAEMHGWGEVAKAEVCVVREHFPFVISKASGVIFGPKHF